VESVEFEFRENKDARDVLINYSERQISFLETERGGKEEIVIRMSTDETAMGSPENKFLLVRTGGKINLVDVQHDSNSGCHGLINSSKEAEQLRE
jgi:hypothetical protein